MKTNKEPVPLIFCGGGSIIINPTQSFTEVTNEMIRPAHFAVCNAIGAALCAVSGTTESIVDLYPTSVDGGMQRKLELDRLENIVRQQCEQNGADPNTIRLVDIEQVPLSYYPGGYKHRVLLTAVGDLDLSKLKKRSFQSDESCSLTDFTDKSPTNSKPPKYSILANKKPVFDETGAWIIDSIDIEYIAYGVGILGCGGGGEPYHTKLSCLQMLKSNACQMRVIRPSALHPTDDLAAVIGFMGAPTVSHEQLPSGNECLTAITTIEGYLSKQITAVFSGEMGGANGLRNLLVGAIKNIPCVDCDSMGRAFPRLDQKLPFILGQNVTPTCMCDVRGRTVLYTDEQIKNARELEDVLRQECIRMGLRGGLCMPPMTGEQVHKYTIHNSLSRAWFIGQARFSHQKNTIEAVAKAGNGFILVSNGKVIDVERHTSTGFARGHVTIETQEQKVLTVDFQNENLVARYADEILASVPDLITLVEQDSGEPLSTETVKYGSRVSVLVLPAPEPMKTEQALKYVGPKVFGYDYEYQSKTFDQSISVWDMY